MIGTERQRERIKKVFTILTDLLGQYVMPGVSSRHFEVYVFVCFILEKNVLCFV